MSVYSHEIGRRSPSAAQRERSLRVTYRAAQVFLYLLSAVLLIATSVYAYS